MVNKEIYNGIQGFPLYQTSILKAGLDLYRGEEGLPKDNITKKTQLLA